jgi:hypothetical protein
MKTAGTKAAAPPPSVVVVSRPEDLTALRRGIRGRVGVQIDLPGLDDERRAYLQRRVERSAAACGCNEGTVAGLLYLLVVPALIFTGRLAPSTPLEWLTIGVGVLAVLIAGKVFGLVAARLALLRALNRIERAFRIHTRGA